MEPASKVPTAIAIVILVDAVVMPVVPAHGCESILRGMSSATLPTTEENAPVLSQTKALPLKPLVAVAIVVVRSGPVPLFHRSEESVLSVLTERNSNIRHLYGVRVRPLKVTDDPLVVSRVPSKTVGKRLAGTLASPSAIAIGLSRSAVIKGCVIGLSWSMSPLGIAV
jgi:hypothetical protein